MADAAHARRQPLNWAANDLRAAAALSIADQREEVDRLRKAYNAAEAEHQRAVENDGRFTRDPRVKHVAVTRAELHVALRNLSIACHLLCMLEGKSFPPTEGNTSD